MIIIGWLITAIFIVLFVSMLVTLRGAPYVPSRARDVRRAFDELYAVGPDDKLFDIGSGDGLILRLAAQRGAQAVGVELNPFLVLLSAWLNRRYPKARTRLGDVWLSRLPADTTLVYVFGTGRDLERITDWVQSQTDRLGRPLYLMSYGFELADRRAYRAYGAHHLYLFQPLQSPKPQV